MTWRWTSVLCSACLCFGACGPATRTTPTFTLSIVGTNDLHGGVLEANGRGGLALLDGYLSNLRAARQQDGGSVLLLDAGDLFQGTLESNLNEGAVVVDAYNAMGYQAAAVGNHEFDFGPSGEATVPRTPSDDPRGALKARLEQAHFPWLAANLVDTPTRAPVALPNVSPSTIITVNNVRVGVVGLLTEPAMTFAMAANVAGLAVTPAARALTDEAMRLRQQGVPIVIALTHIGGKCTNTSNPQDLSSCEPKAEVFELARQLPAGLVDAIVAGHRHEPLANEVNGVPIIQSWYRGRGFGRIDMTVERSTGHVLARRIFEPRELCARETSSHAGCAVPADEGARPAEYEGRPVVPAAAIAALLQPAVDAAAEAKHRPLNATLTAPLVKVDFGQSPVGDLAADWMRAAVPGADLALANSAGMRSDLAEGPLTYGALFELLPFDNQRMVISLTGAQLRTVVAKNIEVASSMVLLSGVRASATCERGTLSVEIRRDSGRLVGDGDTLTVVTSDFLVTGGDAILTPVMPLHVISSGDLLRDEMARAIARLGGTWGAERRTLPSRVSFAGSRPVHCAPER